jgi:hypothetical protein
MDGDEDSHAGDGYATPDGLGDISSIAQFMQGLAVQTRSTSDRLEWDGRQESWKDFWFRFKSMVHGSSAIKSEMLNPGHTPTTAARVKLFHVLVGLLSAPASGKRNKALQILQGYESNKGACAHDGFAALHAIIKTYGQRHESDAMRVEDELRNAMQKDDEDVDDWQLRLEALNADAEEHDVQLSDKRLQLGVVRGLRAAFDVARLLLGKAGSMEMDDLMETLRTAQNIMIHRGVLTNKGHKLPAAAPEIGGALYYTETGGGGDRNGAGGSAEMRTCWACGKPGHIVPNCPNQAAKDKYALEHPRRNRKPATDATPDGKHGGGKRKGACAFCDQDGHHISTCAVKKAITAGKQVGMVNGTMQVLATSAHEQLPLADTAGPYELLEDLEEGIQDFDINAFPVIAVQEKRTPEITTNGRARTHPYDVLNAGLNALDAVGDQGHRTEASDQRAVQAASYTVESEDTQRYWICDTAGGVISITSHSEDFHTLIAATGRVSGVAKGAYTEITGKGTVVVNISDKSGRPATVTFDAFLVPEADVGRLFSVANFDKAGGTGTVGGGAMTLTTPTGVVWVGALDDLSGHYHTFSCPYSHGQNGVVERKQRTLASKCIAQLVYAKLPKGFWWKAMRNAAMMTNISGTRAGDKELHVPMSMWTGEAPSWKNTRIFGCPATVARPLGSVPKGEPRGRMGIFVGNSFESLGWLIFYPDTNRVVTTMHADFDERWQSLSREHFEAAFKAVAPVLLMGEQANAKGKFKAVTWAQELQPLEPTQVDQGIKNDVATGMSSTFDDGTPPATRRSERVADRQLSSAQEHTAAAHVSEHISYLTQHAAGAGDPQSVPEAMRRDDAPQWRTAMEEEWEGLQINNTFEKMNLPPGKVAVDTKWVFKIKKDANGAALKHKGRLCIRGFNMRPGVHFFETYAPTVAIQHLRLVVALAAAHGWDICTTDVKQAYIQAKEENEVYVKQPRDFSDGSTKVLKLLRCLYGSPSAGRQWYKKLNGLLLNFGFDRSIRDECLYLLMTDTRKLIFCLAVHVDDLTGAGPGGLTVWNRLTEMLESNFGCVSVVNPSQILGMKVDRSEDGRIVTLSQPAYVQGMLDRYELAACNTRTVPIEPGTVFTRRDSPPEPNVERREEYQAKVGSLQYAATQGVRMDIAQAVGAAARVLQSPSPAHMTFVNGIFKYLAGNVERGITYDGTTNPEIQLECYADSDFAGQPHEMITADACKSTTGFVIMLAGGAIAWRSRLQKHTATSTGGAEVHAAYECGVEAAALSDVLGEMGFTQKPVMIHEDSNVCISMATSDTISMAHKALKVKYHWLRERVQAGELALRKVDTTLQHADYLTKALPRKTFEAHVRYTMGDKENRN